MTRKAELLRHHEGQEPFWSVRKQVPDGARCVGLVSELDRFARVEERVHQDGAGHRLDAEVDDAGLRGLMRS